MSKPPAIDSHQESQVVIGFTEAQLGIVLAALFLVLWIGAAEAQKPEPTRQKASVDISADSARNLNRLALRQTAVADSLRAIVDSLRPKRSRLIPSCKERGLAGGVLLAVYVLGADRLVVDGTQYTWDGFRRLTSADREQARRNGCIHEVSVSPSPEMPAHSYNTALKRIRSVFRTRL
jgi:hypothetical protein